MSAKQLKKKCKRFDKLWQNSKAENKSLEEEIKQLQDKQREREDVIKQLETKNEEQTRHIEELNGKAESANQLQRRLDEMTAEISGHKDHCLKLQTELSQNDLAINELHINTKQESERVEHLQGILNHNNDLLQKCTEKIECYEHDICLYKNDVEQLKDLKEMLEEDNRKKKELIEQNQERLEQYKKECTDWEEKLQSNVEQISMLEKQVTQLKVEVYDKDRSHKDISLTCQTHENTLKDKDEEDKINKEIIRERETTIDNLLREVQEFKDEKQKEQDDFQKQLQHKDDDKNRLEEVIKDKSRTIDELEKVLQDQTAEISRHEDRCLKLQTEISEKELAMNGLHINLKQETERAENLQHIISEKDDTLQKYAEKVECHENDIEKYKEEVDRVNELNERLNAEISGHKDHCLKLQTELSQKDLAINELQINTKQESERVEHLQDKQREREDVIKQLETKNEEQTRHIEELNGKAESANQLQRRLDEMTDEKQKQKDDFFKQLQQKDDDRKNLEKELQDKNGIIDQLERMAKDQTGNFASAIVFTSIVSIMGAMFEEITEISGHKDHCLKLQTELSQKDLAINELHINTKQESERVEHLQGILNHNNDLLQKCTEKIECYEHDVCLYKKDVEQLKDLKEMLEEDNRKKKELIEQNQERLEQYKKECTDWEEKLESNVEQISMLEKQVTHLKVELYDKDRSHKDISLTCQTHENTLKDKDEEDKINKEIIREQETTIDNLLRDVQEFKAEKQEEQDDFQKQLQHKDDDKNRLEAVIKDKSRTIDELEKMLKDQTAEISRHVDRCLKLQTEISEKDLAMNELHINLKQETERAENLQHIISEKDDTLQKYAEKVECHENAIEKYKEEVDRVNELNERLNAEKEKERHECVEQLKQKDNDWKGVQETLQEKNVIIDYLERNAKDKTAEISGCVDQCLKLQTEISEKDSCINELHINTKQECERVENLQQDNRKKKELLEQYQERLVQYKNDCTDWERKHEESCEQNSMLEKRITQLKVEKQKEQDDFEKQMQLKDDDQTKLNEEIQAKTVIIDKLEGKAKDQTAKIQKEQEDFMKQLQQKDDERKRLEVELQDKTEIIDELERMSKDQTGENCISDRELLQLKKKCKRYEDSCKAKYTEIEKLQEEIKQLQAEKQNEQDDFVKQQQQKDDDRNRLEEDLQDKTDIILEMERKAKHQTDIILERDDALQKFTEKIEWYDTDIEKYKVEVDRVNDLNGILNEENRKKKELLEQYQERVVQCKKDCADWERKHELNVEQVSKLEKQITQLKAELFDKDKSDEDISLTFHTYENALKDKDEEVTMNKEIIRERDTTIDNLKRDLHELKGKHEEINKNGMKQQDENNILNTKLAERDLELENERSLVEMYTTKYYSSVEDIQNLCLQLSQCQNENSSLQQCVVTMKEAWPYKLEAEQCLLISELQTMKENKIKTDQEQNRICDELVKWKKGHAFLQQAKEQHELLIQEKEKKIHTLELTLQDEKSKGVRLESSLKNLSTEISNLHDQNIQSQNTISSLRDSCNERDMKISHLEGTLEQRDESIARLESQYEILSASQSRLIATHENVSKQCTDHINNVRVMEEKLKIAQEELQEDKEAYRFCKEFQQRVHAARLNRGNEDSFERSFRERIPGEDFIDCLQKENLDMKDDLSVITLETHNLQKTVRQQKDLNKQLKKQLNEYKERLFELQRQLHTRKQFFHDD